MNYRYIKALGLSNDNISLAYDVITKKDGVEWMESCNIAVEHITNVCIFLNCLVFELMKQYRSMGYDVPCKMLALIAGTEIPSTQISSTTAKIVRIVKTADKLRGCKKEEYYLKEIFKLSENINLSNRLTNQARVQGGARGLPPPPPP